MTRCPACDEIHASTPHATVTGEECAGVIRGLYDTLAPTQGEVFGIHPDAPLSWQEAIDTGHIAPVRTESFQIEPVTLQTATMFASPEAVVSHVEAIMREALAPIAPETPPPALILDPDRTDGALPPIAPVVPVDE